MAGPSLKTPIPFGKYYLLDRINVGGMAEVFRAKAFGVEGFERILAVKKILPSIAEDEEFTAMFIDEAKIAVQLTHANICQVFDLGKVEDSYFIALEWVFGRDLRAIFDFCKSKQLDGSPTMPIPQACFIIMKACEGLDYAHNKRDAQGGELNLVHRDVSPQNVLISYDGEVKLIDFGIAKAAGKASKTQQGILKGKFGYMSPEQVRGLPLDRRSDIFALGIVLYELLTAERLFIGESDFSTLEKVRNVEILPPSTYNRKVSEELERIVMKALAKDVEDRYQNAIDLHDDLQAYMYATGEFYSRKDLAAWMKRVFTSEIEAETAKLEQYRQMPPPQGVGSDISAPTPLERPGRRIPPPAAPALNGAAAAAPPPPGGKPAGQARAAGGDAELAWDDEEVSTNIYEPVDAGDQVLEDKPDPLAQVELAADGRPVPAPPAPRDVPPPPPSPSFERAAPALGDSTNVGRSPIPTEIRPLEPRRVEPPRTSLYVGVGVVGSLVAVLAVWLFVLAGNKPGEVVITSNPSVNVQVLVDNKRVQADGTPVTLKLEPGSYVLTVQREGFVPWNEQVDIRSGDVLRKQVTLEPLGGTGFTLVSEPAGLKAMIDGNPLDGVTPLKVMSVAPGRHRLEVRAEDGSSWSQEIDVELGKTLELRASLQPKVAAVVPAPSPAPSPTPEPVRPPRPEPERHAEARPTPAPVEPTPPTAAGGDERKPKRGPKAHAPEDDRPRPAVPEERAAASGEGYLRVGSKPWTYIAVDGKDTGLTTPQTQLKLSSGSHRITLSNQKQGIKESFTVEIRGGETVTVVKDLQRQGDDAE